MQLDSTILVSTFLTVALGVTLLGVAVSYALRRQLRVGQRLAEEFGSRDAKGGDYAPLFRNVRRTRQSDDRVQQLWSKLQIVIAQSGLPITAPMVSTACLALAAGAGVATGCALRNVWIGLIVAAACSPAPLLYVLAARKRRLRQLCAQLPEAFEFMCRALRAGQALPSAFQAVGSRFRPPLSIEFANCYEQQQLGVPHDDALRNLAMRCGVMELQIFSVALIVQRRAGGNLAELLSKMAAMMRKRVWVQGRVRALTGEGRLQAVVLIAMPPMVFAALWFLNRQQAQVLLDHPRLLYGVLVSQAIGAFCIRRIVNFEF